MTLELSRRDWLKGLMASAGLVAVGVPLDIIESVAPVISSEPRWPTVIELGDFWIRHRNENFFVGRMVNLSIFPRSDLIHHANLVTTVPDMLWDIDVSVVLDREGGGRLMNVFYDSDVVEAYFGNQHGFLKIEDAFVVSAMIEVNKPKVNFRRRIVPDPMIMNIGIKATQGWMV